MLKNIHQLGEFDIHISSSHELYLIQIKNVVLFVGVRINKTKSGGDEVDFLLLFCWARNASY